jgi:cytochrome c oxidase subunit II
VTTRNTRSRFGLAVRLLLLTLAGLLLASCDDSPSTLAPGGPAAERIAGLWWWLLISATLVTIATFTLLGIALWRSRQDRQFDRLMGMSGDRFAILAGALIPTVILIMVTFVTLDVMADLETPPEEPALVVEVIGWMWWWEVRYPGTDAVTANEIHIPAGQTVELHVWAEDVIHSFWVPEIAGKIDMFPNSVNTMWIKADEPGIYRGQCAEFCGLQHTFMAKLLVVHEPDDFDAWLAAESQPAPEPDDPLLQRGQEVFMENQCLFCHAIRGTEAVGTVGPDLTHVMSRQTLGAATIPNSIGNLAAWTADPHEFKPGVKMPPVNFGGEDFEALIAYLASLE